MSRVRSLSLILILLHALVGVAWGRIAFVASELFPIAGTLKFVGAGDFDRDGIDDLVVSARTSQELNVLFGSTTGRFSRSLVVPFLGSRLNGVAVTDLNQDGLLDIAVADEAGRGGRIWILFGRGNGTFLEPLNVETPSRDPLEVIAADLDGDGDVDLAFNDATVVGLRVGSIGLLLNDGGARPAFRPGGELVVGRKPTDLIAADFVGNDRIDLAALDSGGQQTKDLSIQLNAGVDPLNGLPIFQEFAKFGIGTNPFAVVTGDFNRDGLADMAMLNNPSAFLTGRIEIMFSRGRGFFDGPIEYAIPCPFQNVAELCRPAGNRQQLVSADFDRDGILDFAFTIVDSRATAAGRFLSVMRGFPDGRFLSRSTMIAEFGGDALGTGDFNGDGVHDLAVASATRRNVQIFVNISSTPVNPGEPCIVDDDCVSEVCLDGTCCNEICGPGQTCGVPGTEGECVDLLDNGSPCEFSQECQSNNCVDGFCCNVRTCPDGQRCDICGFEGSCRQPLNTGSLCCGRDSSCKPVASGEVFGFCVDGVCCTQEACPPGDSCQPPDGMCREEPPPTPTPVGPGGRCDGGRDCQPGLFCTDGVCCTVQNCPAGTFCAPIGVEIPGAQPGTCVEGTPLPTRTPTPTRIASQPPPLPTATCPPGFKHNGDLCTSVSRGGGCAISGGDGAPIWPLLLLPVALVLRRRQLRAQR